MNNPTETNLDFSTKRRCSCPHSRFCINSGHSFNYTLGSRARNSCVGISFHVIDAAKEITLLLPWNVQHMSHLPFTSFSSPLTSQWLNPFSRYDFTLSAQTNPSGKKWLVKNPVVYKAKGAFNVSWIVKHNVYSRLVLIVYNYMEIGEFC